MINKLVKIGGALVNSKENFLKLIELISSDDYNNSFFVISGFGKTTSKLRLAAETAINSTDDSIALIEGIIKELINLSPKNASFDVEKEQLLKMIKGINITNELTQKLMDRFLSYGEILSFKLIHLNIDNDIHFVNAEELILTDSNFSKASPDYELSKSKTLTYLNENQYSKYITQGFIAADIYGNRTTMGLESSNLTATLIADILKLKQVTIITDVDGIRNIDPKLSNNTRLIENLNYNDALILANYGLKQIYPKMIEIAEKDNIEIIFRSIDKKSEITKINSERSDSKPVLIVKSLVPSEKDFDIEFFDKNFNYRYKQIEFEKNSSNKTLYIIFNPILHNFIHYMTEYLDVDEYYIDTFGDNVIKLITKNNETDDLDKLLDEIR